MGLQTITILGNDFDATHIHMFGSIEYMQSNRDSFINMNRWNTPDSWKIDSHYEVSFEIYYENHGSLTVAAKHKVSDVIRNQFYAIARKRLPFFGRQDAIDDMRVQIEAFVADLGDELDTVYDTLEQRLIEAHIQGRKDWLRVRSDIPVYRLEVPEGTTVLPFYPRLYEAAGDADTD